MILSIKMKGPGICLACLMHTRRGVPNQIPNLAAEIILEALRLLSQPPLTNLKP